MKNWITKNNDEYIGCYLNTKFIISIDNTIDKDISIIKGFYGLLDIKYKSIDIMNKNLNHAIKKLIKNI